MRKRDWSGELEALFPIWFIGGMVFLFGGLFLVSTEMPWKALGFVLLVPPTLGVVIAGIFLFGGMFKYSIDEWREVRKENDARTEAELDRRRSDH